MEWTVGMSGRTPPGGPHPPGSGHGIPYKPTEDQVVRHMIFRAAHPEITFAFQRSKGRWEATYPDGKNGTQTVCRVELRELLDELEGHLG